MVRRAGTVRVGYFDGVFAVTSRETSHDDEKREEEKNESCFSEKGRNFKGKVFENGCAIRVIKER